MITLINSKKLFMKKIYYAFLLFYTVAFSQNFQWVDFPTTTYTLNPALIGYATTCDNLGNVYCTGFKDNQFSSGDMYGNLFYRKYNTTGLLLFEKIIVGKARVFNIVSDSNGNTYVAASFKSSITIGTTTLTGITSEAPLLIKFDNFGNMLWYKLITDLSASDHFSALAVDTSNYVYIGYDNFFNSAITKLNEDGIVQFTILQQNVKVLSNLSIDSLGSIYATGSCAQPNSIFAGVAQPTSLLYNTYVVKYNSAGLHQWTKYIEDISCLDPQISAKTPDAIYISSSLSGAFAFGTITSQGPSSGTSDDFYITKLNASGDFQWIREVEGTGKAYIGRRNFLTSDSIGNVYFGGSTRGTTVWSNTITTTVTGFGDDALVLKYNSNGDLLMVKTAGGTSSDRCDGIALDNSGNIYVSGMASGSVVFDGITNSVVNNTPFISKIGGSLNTSSFDSTKINLYPNPAQNEFFISDLKKATKGTIYSALGQKLKIVEINNFAVIDINEFAKGVYFIEIEGYMTKKFVKN